MTTVTEKLKHWEALRTQKEEATIKYTESSNAAQSLEKKVYEFGLESTKIETEFKSDKRKDQELSEYEKTTLAKYQKEYDQYLHDLEAATKEKESMNELIRKLHYEIEGSYGQLQVEEALKHVQMMEGIEAEIAQLQKSIAEQENIMAKVTSTVTPLNELIQQRENMLAEIATGDTKETELKALDEQITKARKAAETAKYERNVLRKQ